MLFRVRSMDSVNKYLKTVPFGALKVGLKAFVEYILGNSQRGLRHDEPQKYISRKAAGYTTSAKQIAFFFATGILERVGNSIKLNHYKRTGETANAWKATERNNGYAYTLSNEKTGAYYTRSEDGQSKQHEMAGRRKVSKVIADNQKGAERSSNAAIKKYLGSK